MMTLATWWRAAWAWQPPVTLLAESVPFALAKQLLGTRPGTLTGVIDVLCGKASG